MPVIEIIVLRVSDATTDRGEQADYRRASLTASAEHGVRLEQRCIMTVTSVDFLQMSNETRREDRSQPETIVRLLQNVSVLHVRSAEDCVDLYI